MLTQLLGDERYNRIGSWETDCHPLLGRPLPNDRIRSLVRGARSVNNIYKIPHLRGVQ
jgi:hypothetical protein